MAQGKRPKYPVKVCPGCGQFIHARSLKHEACGWVGEPRRTRKRRKKGKKAAANGRKVHAGGITVHEIEAVWKVVERIGAEKVEQLARVLSK